MKVLNPEYSDFCSNLTDLFIVNVCAPGVLTEHYKYLTGDVSYNYRMLRNTIYSFADSILEDEYTLGYIVKIAGSPKQKMIKPASVKIVNYIICKRLTKVDMEMKFVNMGITEDEINHIWDLISLYAERHKDVFERGLFIKVKSS